MPRAPPVGSACRFLAAAAGPRPRFSVQLGPRGVTGILPATPAADGNRPTIPGLLSLAVRPGFEPGSRGSEPRGLASWHHRTVVVAQLWFRRQDSNLDLRIKNPLLYLSSSGGLVSSSCPQSPGERARTAPVPTRSPVSTITSLPFSRGAATPQRVVLSKLPKPLVQGIWARKKASSSHPEEAFGTFRCSSKPA